MSLDVFIDRLLALQRTISIWSPAAATVKRAYWGAPASITDMPCIINVMIEPDRTLGMGGRREEKWSISMQLFAARVTPEDERSSRIATSFWTAAKDVFDANTSIGGTVQFSTLRGASPTVPVLLQHGGQAYIGFDAFLEVTRVA